MVTNNSNPCNLLVMLMIMIVTTSISCSSANIVGIESTAPATEEAPAAANAEPNKENAVQKVKETAPPTRPLPKPMPSFDGDVAINTPQQVIDLCKNSDVKTSTHSLFFPERVDCTWTGETPVGNLTPGNLGRVQGQLQARESQTETVSLPEGAVICGMNISSQQDEIRYDDFLAIKLENYLLMISNSELLRDMPMNQGVYTWDFDAIKMKPYGFEGGRYCLSDSKCSFPGHDTAGEVEFMVGTDAIAAVSAKIPNQTKLDFTITATGDNDDEDCWHTDIGLDVAIEYAIK